ncbi:MAG TPA: hypothetical protein VKV02_14870, partial [Acidobacteriaceae bacterium]|nr:hypothetical protein [Acidobacteriaceae bacterium]
MQYAQDPSPAEEAAVASFGPLSRHMHGIRALAARVPATELVNLANRPGVTYISLDRAVAARQQPAPIGK